MSLEEHLSKFPNLMDDKYLKLMKFYKWKDAKEIFEKLTVSDVVKVRIAYIDDVRKWKEEHEKLFKAKVSQIQDEIDSLTTERKRKIGEVPKKSYIICEMEGEIVGLETAKALLEGSSGSKCPKGYASDKEDCRRISQRDCDSCEMPKLLEGSTEKVTHCRNPHEIVYRGCSDKCKFFVGCNAVEKKESSEVLAENAL